MSEVPEEQDRGGVRERQQQQQEDEGAEATSLQSWFQQWMDKSRPQPPPFQVEDFDLMFYDIILIVNLAVSVSIWAVHRLDVAYIGSAFNEGCLMSLLWIVSGLWSGAFLLSAVDGHYTGPQKEEKGGPKAAGLLGFWTYVNAINLRLLFALVVAVCEHRPVGAAATEQLIPLEIGFGIVLMSCWRALHSFSVPRI
jgi:hypothetical protein